MRMYKAHLVTLLLLVTLVLGVKGHDPVEVRWGVADTTAEVGRMFRMHVPGDAFSGPVKELQIKSSDGSPLPDWLQFTPSESVLWGLPLPHDAGSLFLDVLATGPDTEAQDSFSLVVREVNSHTSGAPLKFHGSGPEAVRCKRGEPETVATIILDLDVAAQAPEARVQLLRRFTGHMDLQEPMVKVRPVGKSGMKDGNALVSGSGDCESPKTSGTFISWPVGCGQVKSGHMPILQRLDEDSSSGHMAKVLALPVIGWHVTNSHIQAPKRKRRQVLATATPVLTPVVPTQTSTEDASTDEYTRTVPGMESPSIMPTSTQPTMPQTDLPEPTEPTEKKEDDTTLKPTEPEPPKVTEGETPAIQPSMTYTEPSTDAPQPPVVDVVPIELNPIDDKIFNRDYRVGDIIDIPLEDLPQLFMGYDNKDIDLSLTWEEEPAEGHHFLQMDKTNRKIIGIPGDKGNFKLALRASGQEGMRPLQGMVKYDWKIKDVKDQKKINNVLAAVIDLDYDKFRNSIQNQTAMATKISSLYGKSIDDLMVTGLKPGSVVYEFTMKSSKAKGCPIDAIKDSIGKFVKDGKLSEEAKEKMKPFDLNGFASEPKGDCEGDPNFPAVAVGQHPKSPDYKKKDSTDTPATKPTDGKTPDESGEDNVDKQPATDPPVVTKKPTKPTEGVKTGSSKSDDNMLITTIVPAIVIIVILIVALSIACVLYRKRRKGNLNVEEQNTFVNKNTPVIFPNELEDKPSDVTKPLLVEGGGNNSVPPPEYHQDLRNNGNSHQMNNLNTTDEIQEYEPPTPPVTDGSSKHPPQPSSQPFSQPPQILP